MKAQILVNEIAERVSQGMRIAALEYEKAHRDARIELTEYEVETLIDDFHYFVLGWVVRPATRKTYLAHVRRDAKEYAGYAVEFAQSRVAA
jgi:hypothetical protein